MKEIHFILQGKGGVGKSFCASIAGQYYQSTGKKVRCVDTDPVNQTLVGYKALEAEHLPLLDGAKIDQRRFDALIEAIVDDKETDVWVIDNGASSFIPMTHYLAENNVYAVLGGEGFKVVLNVIVTGGQSMLETINGFRTIAQQEEVKNIVVWLNEFFGEIRTNNGKTFEEGKNYSEFKDKIIGLVTIEKRNYDTFGVDVESMIKKKQTFAERIGDPEVKLMERQRLKMVQQDIFSQLANIK